MTNDNQLLSHYNYDEFIPAKFEPWFKLLLQPATAPDYPLWDLDRQQTNLNDIWSQNTYTIIEFGSFT